MVGQQQRELMMLNGRPLVQRKMPENCQSPITGLSHPGTVLPNRAVASERQVRDPVHVHLVADVEVRV